VKRNLIKLGMGGCAVALIASGQPLPWSEQWPTPNVASGGAVVFTGSMNRLSILTSLLALTPSQQEQNRAIFEDEEVVSKPFVEQLKQASDPLESAEKTAATDAEIDQLAANMANILGQILDVDSQVESKTDPQLTANQKQKLHQLPHAFFVPSAPIRAPRAFFTSSASGGTGLTPWRALARPHTAPAKDHTTRSHSVCWNGTHFSESLRREEKQC
jgi:hypothetical protein